MSLHPRIRTHPEDFVVEEIPLYTPSGEGGHTFLWIEKCEWNTEDAVRELARYADVAPRAVGYAGRKDRRAVARQWISVPGLDPERAERFSHPRVRVLRALRHPHKLRVGQLRGNRFALRVVADTEDATAEALGGRLAELAARGFANRFGAQRYGREGDNAARARELLSTGRLPRNRRHARFLLSALQAEVFDAALSERELPPDRVEVGDVAQVCESGGCFTVEDVARESERAARFEISPTGPIFGTRAMTPRAAPGAREAALLERFSIPAVLDQARGIRLRGSRRPLRAKVESPELAVRPGAVDLRFSLASGCYATVFLEALFGEAVADVRD